MLSPRGLKTFAGRRKLKKKEQKVGPPKRITLLCSSLATDIGTSRGSFETVPNLNRVSYLLASSPPKEEIISFLA